MDEKEIDWLKQAVPAIAQELAQLMVNEALGTLGALALTSGVSLATSLTYQPESGGPGLKVTLRVGPADDDDEDEESAEEYPDNGPTDPWQTSGPGAGKGEPG